MSPSDTLRQVCVLNSVLLRKSVPLTGFLEESSQRGEGQAFEDPFSEKMGRSFEEWI